MEFLQHHHVLSEPVTSPLTLLFIDDVFCVTARSAARRVHVAHAQPEFTASLPRKRLVESWLDSARRYGVSSFTKCHLGRFAWGTVYLSNWSQATPTRAYGHCWFASRPAQPRVLGEFLNVTIDAVMSQ